MALTTQQSKRKQKHSKVAKTEFSQMRFFFLNTRRLISVTIESADSVTSPFTPTTSCSSPTSHALDDILVISEMNADGGLKGGFNIIDFGSPATSGVASGSIDVTFVTDPSRVAA